MHESGQSSSPGGSARLGQASANGGATDRPNVLLILTDQLRADTLGCYGNDAIRTPNIDALARAGIRYNTCYTPYPICTPARYSLLTGVHAHEHRGQGNHSTPLPMCRSFVQQFREHGYRTTAVGKMHFTPTYLDVGYDRMILAEQDGPGRFDDDYHRELTDAGMVDAIDLIDQRREYRDLAPEAYWQTRGAMPSNLPEGWDSTTWIGDKAMAELDAWADDGNLLTVSFIKPHHPFDPPEPWFSRHDPGKTEPLPGWCEQPHADDLALHKGYFPHCELILEMLRRVTAAYYGCIEQIDHHVGRLVDRLAERKMLENTCIVFVADHGEYLGAHHLLLKNNRMYEPLVRVPLIIRPAGGCEAGGETASRLASLVDLPRTLCTAAGIDPPATADGEDLLQPTGQRAFVFAAGGQGSFAVRSAHHKLLWHADPKQVRFFDLEADPLEQDGQHFDRHSDLFRQHESALLAWLASTLHRQPAFVGGNERALPSWAERAGQAARVQQRLDQAVRAWLAQHADDAASRRP
ncbi:MAG: sulfatase-like hydrolase/transferase [Phycisphaeraceae bacterium]